MEESFNINDEFSLKDIKLFSHSSHDGDQEHKLKFINFVMESKDSFWINKSMFYNLLVSLNDIELINYVTRKFGILISHSIFRITSTNISEFIQSTNVLEWIFNNHFDTFFKDTNVIWYFKNVNLLKHCESLYKMKFNGDGSDGIIDLSKLGDGFIKLYIIV